MPAPKRSGKVRSVQPKSSVPPPVQSYVATTSGSRNTVQLKQVQKTQTQSTTASSGPSDYLTFQHDLLRDYELDDIDLLPPSQNLGFEVDDIAIEDMPDDPEVHAIPNKSDSGKGQNEMLNDWKMHWAGLYLDELYNMHSPPTTLDLCGCGSQLLPDFRCLDCLSSQPRCKDCLKKAHLLLPTHRVDQWHENRWARKSLKDIGVVLALGLHSKPCHFGSIIDFTLGDVTGLHDISVCFCGCSSAVHPALQLLRSNIYACSEASPSSGFTLALLRFFHLAATEAKVPTKAFYTVVQRQNNNVYPHVGPHRYRELLRVTRAWMFLSDQKRFGVTPGDPEFSQIVALRCPACPRLNVNFTASDITPGHEYLYTVHISYDGSFKLVRKNKSADKHGSCLSNGTKFFVEQNSYQVHLAANAAAPNNQSAKGSDCNNHRAANAVWANQEGLAETGLGACSCGRHTFMLPLAVVNYFKGEKFAYTDYAVGSALQTAVLEGAPRIGVFYDIFCHWSRNLAARIPKLTLPNGPLSLPSNFFGGVPKYHLAGHTDGCYAQYSLNHMQGIGRLDAEGCERAWANLNQAASSTCEKGHGSRIEALNHCMQDWNWKKTVGIITHITRKHAEAEHMASEQLAMWEAFDKSIEPELKKEWATLSTEPSKVNGRWTSVFLMSTSVEPSVTQTLLALNLADKALSSASQDYEGGFTGPSWILEGIEVEAQQSRLQEEVRRAGSKPTPKQALDLFNQRNILSARITRHRNFTSHFIDLEIPSMNSGSAEQEAADGHPEVATLYLPSSMAKQLSLTERTMRLKTTEIQLRRVKCHQSLQRLRTAALQKAKMLWTKMAHAKGETGKTRIQSMMDRLTTRIDACVNDYSSSRRALLVLSGESLDASTFRALTSSETKGLMGILTANRELGEGHKALPWFWYVRAEGVFQHVNEQEEEKEATRVEWFRGRERYKRWQEEELILRREAASVIFDFEHRRIAWSERSTGTHAQFNAGYRAYCLKQADLWLQLRLDAFNRTKEILQKEPAVAIGMRAIHTFS